MVRRDLTFFKHRTRSNTFCNMKTLLVLSAAVAAASAEADPQFLYHGYAPAAYYNSYVNPFLYPTLKKVEEPKVEKAEEEMKVETPMVYSPYLHHPYAFNYPYPHHPYAPYMPVVKAAEEEKKVEKREAEADPYLLYNTHYYPYNHYSAYYAPYHYAVGGCRNNFGAVVPCA